MGIMKQMHHNVGCGRLVWRVPPAFICCLIKDSAVEVSLLLESVVLDIPARGYIGLVGSSKGFWYLCSCNRSRDSCKLPSVLVSEVSIGMAVFIRVISSCNSFTN